MAPTPTLISDVVGLGDVNGDGVDDFAIAQDGTRQNPYAYFGEIGDPRDRFDNGVVYVIYGGTSPNAAVENAGNMAGFRVDMVGQVTDVFNAGDVNGDGFNDVGINSTERYTGYTGELTIDVVDDQNGNGQYDYGETVYTNYYQYSLGQTKGYVIFGTDQARVSDPGIVTSGTNGGAAATTLLSGPATTNTIVDSSMLDGSDGFEVGTRSTATRLPYYGYSGYLGYNFDGGELISMGDFNGDGFADLLSTDIDASLGANYFTRYDYNGYSTWQPFQPYVGQSTNGAFMVFGMDDTASSFSAFIGDNYLNPNHDYRVSQLAIFNGVFNGVIGSIGDASGDDGLDDIAFGGSVGPSVSSIATQNYIGMWLVHGTDDDPFSPNTFGGPASVRQFDRDDVLTSKGAFFYDSAGGFYEGEPAVLGDVNGDGIDDFLIHGRPISGDRDVAYIVMGQATPFTGLFDLAGNSQVYKILDPDAQSFVNFSQADGAQDLNGDGHNDIVIGEPAGNGLDGKSYVIFGGPNLLEALDRADGTDDNIMDLSNLDTEIVAAVPTPGDDNIFGTIGDDTVVLLNGNDVYSGGDGDDSISGSQGNDQMQGDAGLDTIIGGSGNDTLSGGDGDDFLNGQVGDDYLSGGADNDELFRLGGADTLSGGDGNDKVVGGDGNDLGSGGAGTDTLNGSDGDDTLFGGAGQDTLNGQDDNDVLDGGADNDFLSGGNGNDMIDGGAGNDRGLGGNGDDTIDGGADNDVLIGGSGDDSIIGGDGDDRINGQTDDDTLEGGAGNDSISGAAGNDSLDGGAGADTLAAGAGNDTLEGGADAGILSAGAGNDSLDGGAGDDSMDSSSGSDTMTGGADADTFILSHQGAASNGDVDVITDLDFAEDELIIRAFTGNAETTVTSGAQLFALGLPGLTIDDTGSDTTLTFDEGGGNVHTVTILGLDDPLTPL